MIIKDEKELAGLREIGKICALTLQTMAEAAKAGMTTAELDKIGRQTLEAHGAQSAPIFCYQFPGHTCISVNEEVAHGIPGPRVLQRGDSVNIDVSAHKDGFFGDTGTTLLIEPATEKHKKLLACCRRCLDKALSVAIAGKPLNGLGLAVEKEARRNGYTTIKNLCGHGIGRSLHEDPESIYNYHEKADKRLLIPGMVLAVEPFVSDGDEYVQEQDDGWTLKTPNHSFTAQYEHTIVITEGLPIILTALD